MPGAGDAVAVRCRALTWRVDGAPSPDLCSPGAVPPPLCSSYCGTQAGSPGCSRWMLLPVSAPPAGCCILPSAYSPLCITLLPVSREKKGEEEDAGEALVVLQLLLRTWHLCPSSCGARHCHCFFWYRARARSDLS
ncbi:hypothetical protein GDO81_003566 [Engystomops pustulosus]|uniref:Uncharacterized protein n=1 Tax=Engystomops pustulosus TaxID=76066 RepID=A0AAV7A6I7_ENGPU|nr:hypothetical protein GDO81_003566 [Engystomops pustulosus]